MQEGDNIYDALVLSKKRWEKKGREKMIRKGGRKEMYL